MALDASKSPQDILRDAGLPNGLLADQDDAPEQNLPNTANQPLPQQPTPGADTLASPVSGGAKLGDILRMKGVNSPALEKLSKGMDQHVAANLQAAAQPGGWARALVGGAQALLGGLGDAAAVGTVPSGGGALEGIARTMQAQGQRQRQQRIDTQEGRERDQRIALTQAQTIAAERLNQHNTVEDQKEYSAMGKAGDDAISKNHPLVDAKVTEDEIKQGVAQGKYDPHTMIWRPVETVVVNGKPQTLWNVRQRTSAPTEVTPEIAQRWKEAGLTDQDGKPLNVSGPVDGDTFDSYQTIAESRLAYQKTVHAAEREAGLQKKTEERQDLSGKDQDLLTSHLGAHMWENRDKDRFEILRDLSNQKGPDGQPTQVAQAAGRQLAQYDPSEMDKHFQRAETKRHNIAMEEQKKTLNLDFSGDPNATTSEEFLGSLDPRARSVVELIHSGRAPLNNPGYLLARKPEVLAAVEKAYPGEFDASKVKSYQDTYKDFTSGKTSVALNSGGTALKHLSELKKINDDNPTESRVPGTDAYKAFHNKLDTLAGELVKFYGMPDTDKSINAMKGTLGGITRRDAAIVEQAKSMGDKLDSYEQTWTNAAPSKAYQAPMPYVDDTAKRARGLLDPDYARRSGQTQGLQPQLPPAALQQLKEGHNTTFRNGQTWTLQAGKPVQVKTPSQGQ